MTRAELATMIASYMHRADLSSQILEWIDMAASRIGRDLRATELEGYGSIAMVSGVGLLPDGTRQVRAITNGSTTLLPIGIESITELQGNGNGAPPAFYALAGQAIIVAPLFTGDLGIIYFTNPTPLVNDGDSNNVLTNYPYIYLYAALIEGFFYTQDGDLMKAAEQRYYSEVALINTASAELRGGNAKAMRSVRR